ncbi:MAG TPA: TonB-dependent receptor [Ignavibacteriaceae bacterium]|nr:TonB-dependent receptor [Ignavibacteriaceae bacterium]
MNSRIIFISLMMLFPALVMSQDRSYELNEIIITAGRIPASFNELTRSVIVINQDEIKNLPAENVQDILQYSGSVDIRQRGLFGVQADVSIRGGTFDQSLVLIDGMKVNDPQTGHHNLNLPVSLQDIDRIEILKGQGSRMFGPDAFSGVINIITKKDASRNLSFSGFGGENGYYNGDLNFSYSTGPLNNYISLSKSKSDGYIHNTDFDLQNFSYHASLGSQQENLNLFLGYNEKEFGANGFYALNFPNQWEHTKTRFAGLSSTLGNEIFSVTPKIYWRRHNDRFLLNYLDPAFYENNHQTDLYSAELQTTLKTSAGDFSLGGEYLKDQVKSNNLGNHKRENKGAFGEFRFSPFENLFFNAGGFIYDYAEIGWRFWPGIDAAYRILPSLKVYGSFGKAFRIPTYTELYYSDQTSQGNPNLHHEESVNYEIGLGFFENSFIANLSLFRKEGKNIIDWVRVTSSEKWFARNIGELNTNGVEVNLDLNPQLMIEDFPINKLNISYTYLDSDQKTEGLISRYVFDHLRNQVIIIVNHYLPYEIIPSWVFRYEDRVGFPDNFLTDVQLKRVFKVNQVGFELSLKAENLFNKSYKDLSTVPLPGRWIIAGLSVDLSL